MACVSLALCLRLLVCYLTLCCQPGATQPTPFRQVYPDGTGMNDSLVPLYFGLAVSFGGDQTSAGAIPGVQLALDHINNDPRVLEGYVLKYTLTDSQCSNTDALDGLYAQLLKTPNERMSTIGLIDASCSNAIEPAALVSRYYNVPHFSCAPFTPSIKDKGVFRNLFQLVPSDEENAQIFLGIILSFEWKRVALIVQEDRQFVETVNTLKELLTLNDVEYSERRFRSSNVLASRNDLFDSGARVFVLAMYSSQARQLICKAYVLNMRYPKYVFLTYGSYESTWWVPPLEEDVFHQCTPDNRAEVLQYSLAVLSFQLSTANEEGMGTTSFSAAEYEESLGVPPFYFTSYEYAQHCYDAVWALALALNKTAGRGYDLQHFEYGDRMLSQDLLKVVRATNFAGITGDVSFKSDGTRTVNRQRVLQYRTTCNNCSLSGSLVPVDIALLTDDAISYVDQETDATVWGDGVPYDGVLNKVIASVSAPIASLFYILGGVGLTLSMCCFGVNWYSIRTRKLRLSSLKLNFLIVFGVMLVYTSITFLFIPTSNKSVHIVFCNLQIWTLSIGYSLAIGTITAKLFRIHYYYNAAGSLIKKRAKLSDWKLTVFVLLLVACDVTVLLTYSLLEATSSPYDLELRPNKELESTITGVQSVITEYCIYLCNSTTRPYLRTTVSSILYGTKGILQFVAIFLVFQTRRLKNENPTMIAIIVYITSTQFVINLLATVLLREYLYAYPVVFAIALLIGATSILGCIFIPLIVVLKKGEEQSESSECDQHQREDTLATGHGGMSYNDLRNRIRTLESRVQQSTLPGSLR